MKLGQRRTFLPLAAAWVTLGCVSLTAPVDRTLTRGELTARIEKASARPFQETRVAVVLERVPAGMKLVQASVNASSGDYCGGVQAGKLSRTPETPADAPLQDHERLVLEFPAEALTPLTTPAPRLDLLVESEKGTRRCLPFEVAPEQKSLAWEYDQHVTIGLDLSLEGYTGWQKPVIQIAAFTGTVGYWIDRYRLELGVGIGGAGCPDRYCTVQNADSKIDYTTTVPLHLGVQTAIWEAGEWSFGVGARYRVIKLGADTHDGRVSFWSHGPVLAPYVAAVLPVSPQTKFGGSRVGLIGFEVPVGYVMTDDGEHTFSVGVNLRSFFTAL